MPAFSTHYIFALETQNEIKKLFAGKNFSLPAFYHGTQGPDFMFSHRLWTNVVGGFSLREVGSEMHHVCPSKMFGLMKKYIETEDCDRDLLLSYVYGFICHYALDRNCHPLVYAIQEELTRAKDYGKRLSFTVHNQIEGNIDSYLIVRKLGYTDSRQFCTADTLSTDPHLINEMAGLIHYVLTEMKVCYEPREIFAEAFRQSHYAQKVLHDPTGLKRKAFSVIELPILNSIGTIATGFIRRKDDDGEWDYMNMRHTQWSLKGDRSQRSDEDFMTLYERAKGDAFEMIKAFNTEDAENNIKAICGDMSFDTGLRYDIQVE